MRSSFPLAPQVVGEPRAPRWNSSGIDFVLVGALEPSHVEHSNHATAARDISGKDSAFATHTIPPPYPWVPHHRLPLVSGLLAPLFSTSAAHLILLQGVI